MCKMRKINAFLLPCYQCLVLVLWQRCLRKNYCFTRYLLSDDTMGTNGIIAAKGTDFVDYGHYRPSYT